MDAGKLRPVEENLAKPAAANPLLPPKKATQLVPDLEATVREWADALIVGAPLPTERAPFEVMLEALPDLCRRLRNAS